MENVEKNENKIDKFMENSYSRERPKWKEGNEMIDLHGDISILFLKKSRFTGSYQGMRYALMKAERPVKKDSELKTEESEEMETVIRGIIWPEPFNFEVTPDEKKHSCDFPFNTDGLWAAVDWLNKEHEAGHF